MPAKLFAQSRLFLGMVKFLIGLVLSIGFFPATAQISKDCRKLSEQMAGTYSSERQHQNDSSYFDIRLKMVPIWTDRSDACWLYVEQALASKQDKPYRQRVYRVREIAPGQFESAVFTLKSPLRFAGKPEMLQALNPDSLTAREGCAVMLRKTAKKRYEGGTVGTNCVSDLKSAAYATSEVIIERKLLLSWDRGFDASGKQVWGAEKGGYRFVKQ